MAEPSTCQYCGDEQTRSGACPRCDGAMNAVEGGEAKGWKNAFVIAAGLLGLAVASVAMVAE